MSPSSVPSVSMMPTSSSPPTTSAVPSISPTVSIAPSVSPTTSAQPSSSPTDPIISFFFGLSFSNLSCGLDEDTKTALASSVSGFLTDAVSDLEVKTVNYVDCYVDVVEGSGRLLEEATTEAVHVVVTESQGQGFEETEDAITNSVEEEPAKLVEITAEKTGKEVGDVITVPQVQPTEMPSASPTGAPTESPTGAPTESPTGAPTESPTQEPSDTPSDTPSSTPSSTPFDSSTLRNLNDCGVDQASYVCTSSDTENFYGLALTCDVYDINSNICNVSSCAEPNVQPPSVGCCACSEGSSTF